MTDHDKQIEALIDSYKNSRSYGYEPMIDDDDYEAIRALYEENKSLEAANITLHDELRRVKIERDRLEARLEINPDHKYDGITSRDETIRGLEARIEKLKAEREGKVLVPIKDITELRAYVRHIDIIPDTRLRDLIITIAAQEKE